MIVWFSSALTFVLLSTMEHRSGPKCPTTILQLKLGITSRLLKGAIRVHLGMLACNRLNGSDAGGARGRTQVSEFSLCRCREIALGRFDLVVVLAFRKDCHLVNPR